MPLTLELHQALVKIQKQLYDTKKAELVARKKGDKSVMVTLKQRRETLEEELKRQKKLQVQDDELKRQKKLQRIKIVSTPNHSATQDDKLKKVECPSTLVHVPRPPRRQKNVKQCRGGCGRMLGENHFSGAQWKGNNQCLDCLLPFYVKAYGSKDAEEYITKRKTMH